MWEYYIGARNPDTYTFMKPYQDKRIYVKFPDENLNFLWENFTSVKEQLSTSIYIMIDTIQQYEIISTENVVGQLCYSYNNELQPYQKDKKQFLTHFYIDNFPFFDGLDDFSLPQSTINKNEKIKHFIIKSGTLDFGNVMKNLTLRIGL